MGRGACLLASVALLAAGAARGETQPPERTPSEYEVKAAFLYHFAQLVQWPGEADAREPITIAVVGRDPFGSVLDETVASHSVRGRALRVERARQAGELATRPHILFVGAADAVEAERLWTPLRDAPVLTVGELPGMASHGCMIEFRLTEDGRVAFDVNLRKAERARLRLSSQLLKVARRVVER